MKARSSLLFKARSSKAASISAKTAPPGTGAGSPVLAITVSDPFSFFRKTAALALPSVMLVAAKATVLLLLNIGPSSSWESMPTSEIVCPDRAMVESVPPWLRKMPRLIKVASGAPTMSNPPENSEVLPFGSVAVAVTFGPPVRYGNVTSMAASPELSVVTSAEPNNNSPSPKPEVSSNLLPKNSR